MAANVAEVPAAVRALSHLVADVSEVENLRAEVLEPRLDAFGVGFGGEDVVRAGKDELRADSVTPAVAAVVIAFIDGRKDADGDTGTDVEVVDVFVGFPVLAWPPIVFDFFGGDAEFLCECGDGFLDGVLVEGVVVLVRGCPVGCTYVECGAGGG